MITSDVSTFKPLSFDLYEEIRSDILTGRLADGSKLSEQSVCSIYKVSRTPVREALIKLESEGLLNNIPNRGAFVRGLSHSDVSDIFDLRSICEVQAVEWAIMRMSTEEIDKLAEAFEMMEFYTLSDESDKVLGFNSDFHNIILAGSRNRMLESSLNSYRLYLRHALPEASYSSKLLKLILKEHKAVFDAFESKNPAEGKAAMEHHMQQTKARRLKGY